MANFAQVNGVTVNGTLISTFEGVIVEFEQSVVNTAVSEVIIEQSVGVSFEGVVVEFLQNVQLRSSSGGLGAVAVEFQQSVVKPFTGDIVHFMQMVVDDE